MADQLHFALSKFRNTMLSAVAELEFELRDQIRSTTIYPTPLHHVPHEPQLEEMARKIEFLEATLKQVLGTGVTPRQNPVVEVQPHVEELLKVEPVANSRNVLVSVRNTPALTAAVAVAAMPPAFGLETDEEEEEVEVVEEEEEEEVEVVEEEEEEEVEVVEEEEEEEVEVVEEEEEEVEVEVVEEEEVEVVEEEEEEVEVEVVEEGEEEDDEEAIEVEEFEYKGKTYQRDAEGTVYLDGEEIGTWNGKKIILT